MSYDDKGVVTVKYTLQKRLDVRELGERWGCTLTNFINMFEHDTQQRVDDAELKQFIGGIFMGAYADMANYKHHEYAGENRGKPPEGWGAKANPEWHYYCQMRLHIYAEGVEAFKKRTDHLKYRVAIMRTQYKTNHYCLLAPFDELINPDMSLEGPIIDTRPMIY